MYLRVLLGWLLLLLLLLWLLLLRCQRTLRGWVGAIPCDVPVLHAAMTYWLESALSRLLESACVPWVPRPIVPLPLWALRLLILLLLVVAAVVPPSLLPPIVILPFRIVIAPLIVPPGLATVFVVTGLVFKPPNILWATIGHILLSSFRYSFYGLDRGSVPPSQQVVLAVRCTMCPRLAESALLCAIHVRVAKLQVYRALYGLSELGLLGRRLGTAAR